MVTVSWYRRIPLCKTAAKLSMDIGVHQFLLYFAKDTNSCHQDITGSDRPTATSTPSHLEKE